MIASSYSNRQALSHLKALQLEWQPHPVSPKRVQQRIQTCHGSDKQCIDRKRFKENGTLTHKDGKKNCIPLVRDSSHIFETFSYSRVLDCTHKWFPWSGIELLAQDSGWWFDALVAAAAAEDVVVLHAAAAKSQTLLLACNPSATSVPRHPPFLLLPTAFLQKFFFSFHYFANRLLHRWVFFSVSDNNTKQEWEGGQKKTGTMLACLLAAHGKSGRMSSRPHDRCHSSSVFHPHWEIQNAQSLYASLPFSPGFRFLFSRMGCRYWRRRNNGGSHQKQMRIVTLWPFIEGRRYSSLERERDKTVDQWEEYRASGWVVYSCGFCSFLCYKFAGGSREICLQCRRKDDRNRGSYALGGPIVWWHRSPQEQPCNNITASCCCFPGC